MSLKSVSIIQVSENFARDQISKFIEAVSELDCEIIKVTTIPEQLNLVRYEIDWAVKYSDLVLVISQRNAVVNGAIGKILSQKVEYRPDFDKILSNLNYAHDKTESYLPAQARIITNNCYPIVHLQRIFIININDLKRSYESLKPYLQHYRKEKIYRKILDIKLTSDDLDILKENLINNGACVEYTRENDIYKVNISSSNFSKLIEHEQAIMTRLRKHVVGYRIEDLDVWQDIFSSGEPHLKKSLETIEKCIDDYGMENVFLSFNGGKDCTVLLHIVLIILRKKYPLNNNPIFCLYVQSEHPFLEQDEFIRQCQQYYNLNLFTVQTNIKEALNQTLKKFPHYKACFMGTRRTDPFAFDLKQFQMTDSSWPQIMRVNPLLDWHYTDIWDYLLFYKVPYCKLYDMGYTSLGNTTNTIKNSSLAYYNIILDKEMYLPAYKLLKEGDERNGRESR